MVRFTSRLLGITFAVSTMMIVAVVARVLLPSQKLRRRFAARNLSMTCRVALWIAGVRVKLVDGHKLPTGMGGTLVVSNHLSYIDVLVISSLMPTLFVTSVEVEQSPLLGQICKAGGSYFVERRSPVRLARELIELRGVLKSGDAHLVVFPEATSSDGEGILLFKNALFDSAVKARVPVQPLCLRYTRANQCPVDRVLRDSIFYYGDMTFFDHFKRFLSLSSLEVELVALDPIPVDEKTDRKVLSETARSAILAAYGQPFGPKPA